MKVRRSAVRARTADAACGIERWQEPTLDVKPRIGNSECWAILGALTNRRTSISRNGLLRFTPYWSWKPRYPYGNYFNPFNCFNTVAADTRSPCCLLMWAKRIFWLLSMMKVEGYAVSSFASQRRP